MLHLQMPTDMFGTLRCADESGVSAGLVYAGGIQDPPIQNIGFAVAQALKWDNADAVMLPYTLVVRSSVYDFGGQDSTAGWLEPNWRSVPGNTAKLNRTRIFSRRAG